jgi:hypothetical protein
MKQTLTVVVLFFRYLAVARFCASLVATVALPSGSW